MAMTPAATVAAQIVADLGIPAAGQGAATTAYVALVTRILAAVQAGTVNVTIGTATATGAMSGGPGVPVVGSATGTIS